MKMTETEQEKLLPCPFCGGYDLTANIDSYKVRSVGGDPVIVPISTTITCHTCGYTMEFQGDCQKIWNSRPAEVKE